uniref:cytochrome c oxidase subunit 7A-related protein, mitochondrial-like n=1 Tax=Halichoerus grypus TaxID=9711 RepID=UPI001658FB92|nr:cytochrome c oxidase subunit 7A-related protein, mitochondrial-like [Halichoerus grypus]
MFLTLGEKLSVFATENDSHCGLLVYGFYDIERVIELRKQRLREAGHRASRITSSVASQKLTGTWASDACSPQGLRPEVSTEAPPIIFATPTKLSSDFAVYDYAGKNKVPELQKFFQKSDGVPIHLKRGLPDQMLHRTTLALTLGWGWGDHLLPDRCLHGFVAQKQMS